ncbi:hypothetical protein PR048_027848 [Dryococelus australis]|uniref:PiggyBac transposable element-derived protein domain-containing protein n=1 Tax=Dryococelus australis TaxID=614101 RepID=A0ABQ9GHP7_9NEOP|nr:hypothetical protein PR048_027848 [Dryococelus australis]
MPKNRFDKLRTFFHVNDNSNMLRRDDPAYGKVFKGGLGFTQYIRNKPHKWGIKMFAIAGTSGILYDFIIYTGKDAGIPECGLGISGDVVIKLIEHLPRNKNFRVFCDNWISSYKLFVALKQNGLLAARTVRSNRLQGCKLKSDVDLKKQGRGSFDQKTDLHSFCNSCKVVRQQICEHDFFVQRNPTHASSETVVRCCEKNILKCLVLH